MRRPKAKAGGSRLKSPVAVTDWRPPHIRRAYCHSPPLLSAACSGGFVLNCDVIVFGDDDKVTCQRRSAALTGGLCYALQLPNGLQIHRWGGGADKKLDAFQGAALCRRSRSADWLSYVSWDWHGSLHWAESSLTRCL